MSSFDKWLLAEVYAHEMSLKCHPRKFMFMCEKYRFGPSAKVYVRESVCARKFMYLRYIEIPFLCQSDSKTLNWT